MLFNRNDPKTWPTYKPLIIAHDVGRSRDRSTAVVGGNCPIGPQLLGMEEFTELPPKLFGSARANALAATDRKYNSNAIIVADLSNDATYAESLCERFGSRVIGLHITRSGDGMNPESRQVKDSSMLVYKIGRSHLLELFHSELQADKVRIVDSPNSKRAYEQLTNLETELRESGTVYTCPPGQHDDLGISAAMLAWAARHPHLREWVRNSERSRIVRERKPAFGWGAFT
jgi:hypothetical protein